MRISLAIPVLNAAPALRTTLQSIRSAGGAGSQIIVQDGGSSDGVEEVVREFPDVVSTFTSGRDGGQYEAINRALAKAEGEVFSWLNAGDIFLPGALDKAAEIFATHPDVEWITGRQCAARDANPLIFPCRDIMVSDFEIRLGLCNAGAAGFLSQEGMFWRRELWEACGGLDTSLSMAADFDLWMRMAGRARLHRVSAPLAAFSYHGNNRSIVGYETYLREVESVLERRGLFCRAFRSTWRFATLVLKAASRAPFTAGPLSLLLRCVCFPRVETFEWRRGKEPGEFLLKRRRRVSWVG